MSDKFSKGDVTKRLSALDGWTIKDSCLVKEFEFKDFSVAMKFINDMSLVAERLNHHPDWSNSYNKVVVSLTTHSKGGLTQKDFDFAEAADLASHKLL